jgi:hypothetical protein
MAIYLDKRGTIYLRHQLSHMARPTTGKATVTRLATGIATSKRPTIGIATCKRPATTVSPRHESWHCRGYLGGKKSLFCEFSQNKATHFPRRLPPPATTVAPRLHRPATTAARNHRRPQPPPRPTSTARNRACAPLVTPSASSIPAVAQPHSASPRVLRNGGNTRLRTLRDLRHLGICGVL